MFHRCLIITMFTAWVLLFFNAVQAQNRERPDDLTPIKNIQEISQGNYYQQLSLEERDALIVRFQKIHQWIISKSVSPYDNLHKVEVERESNKRFYNEVRLHQAALSNWIAVEEDSQMQIVILKQYFLLYEYYPFDPKQSTTLYHLARSLEFPEDTLNHWFKLLNDYDVKVSFERLIPDQLKSDDEKYAHLIDIDETDKPVMSICFSVRLNRPVPHKSRLKASVYQINSEAYLAWLIDRSQKRAFDIHDDKNIKAYVREKELVAQEIEHEISLRSLSKYPLSETYYHGLDRKSVHIIHWEFLGDEGWSLVVPNEILSQALQLYDHVYYDTDVEEDEEPRLLLGYPDGSVEVSFENVSWDELLYEYASYKLNKNQFTAMYMDDRFLSDDVRAYVVSQSDIVQYYHRFDHGHDKAHLLTTDRTIYRPGDQVHFKIIRREYPKGQMQLPANTSVTVILKDVNDREIDRLDARWSSYGSTSGTFELDVAARTGVYEVYLQDGDDELKQSLIGGFKVSAYRKSDMKTELKLLEVNQTHIKVRLDAHYYSGGEMNKGQVNLELLADYPWDYWGSHSDGYEQVLPVRINTPTSPKRAWFSQSIPEDTYDEPFGSFYVRSRPAWFSWYTTLYESSYDLKDASLVLTIPVKSKHENDDDIDDPKFTRRIIKVTTVDAIGQVDETLLHLPDALFAKGHVPPDIRITADKNILHMDEMVEITLHLCDDQGAALPNTEATLILSELWNYHVPRDGAINHPLLSGQPSHPNDRELMEFLSLHQQQVKSDAEGKVVLKLPVKMKKSGIMRISAVVIQNKKRYQAHHHCLVVDPAEPVGLTDDFYSNAKLNRFKPEDIPRVSADTWLYTDRIQYNAGQTIRMLVVQTMKHKGTILIAGQGFHKTFDIPEAYHAYFEFKIPEDYPIGSVMITFFCDDPRFSYQYKWVVMQNIFVDNPRNQVQIKLKTDHKEYAPGQKMRVDIQTLNQGRAVKSELEIAVVDEAIYRLQEDNSSQIERVFRPDLYESGRFHVGRYVGYGIRYNTHDLAESRQTGIDSIFSGGGGPDFYAAPIDTRMQFQDTAYYIARVETDEQGQLTAEIPLPDDLTEWRIVVRAVSGLNRFGQARTAVITKRPLTARVIGSRFYTEGDRAQLQGVIHNHTDQVQHIKVNWNIQGAKRDDLTGDQIIKLKPYTNQTISQAITVNQVTPIKITLTARGQTAADEIQVTRPVVPMGIGVRLGETAMVKDQWKTMIRYPDDYTGTAPHVRLIIGDGGKEVIEAAIPQLIQYPYGCVEQTMSRFLPALIAMRYMKKHGFENKEQENKLTAVIQKGVERLKHFQHADGGWGWWQNDKSDLWMTAYVLWGLIEAKDAGHTFPDAMLKRGFSFLAYKAGDQFNELKPEPRLRDDGLIINFDVPKPVSNYHPLAFYVLTRYTDKSPKIIVSAGEFHGQKDYLVQAGLSGELVEVGDEDTSELMSFKIKHERDLAWLIMAGYHSLHTLLPEKPKTEGALRGSLNTHNALMMMARHQVNPNDPLLDAFRLDLLNNRRGGQWESTLDTGYAIMALSRVISEGEPDPVKLTINGQLQEAQSGVIKLEQKHFKSGQLDLRVEGKSYVSWSMSYLRKMKNDEVLIRENTNHFRVSYQHMNDEPINMSQPIRLKVGDQVRLSCEFTERTRFRNGMLIIPIPAGLEPRIHQTLVFESAYQPIVLDHEIRLPFTAENPISMDGVFLIATQSGEFYVPPAYVFDMYNPELKAHGQALKFVITEGDPVKNDLKAEE